MNITFKGRNVAVTGGSRGIGRATALAFAAVLVNARLDLFAGVVGTQPALETVFPAAAVVVVFAFLGYQLVRRTTNRMNDLLVAMAVAPVALVLFAFLRGLDALSQTLVYRSFDFLGYTFRGRLAQGPALHAVT